MTTVTLAPEMKAHLNDLFSRAYYSAAGYVFESRPFYGAPDGPILDAIQRLRMDDRRHAQLLANLIEMYDEVPEPGVFRYWYRDLNYLTVPYMVGFVIEALQDDIAALDTASGVFPESYRFAHTTLRTIRRDKERALERLLPVASEAREREAKDYKAAADAIEKTRKDRLAKEKAAKAAARQKKASGAAAAAPVSLADIKVDEAAIVKGMPDPYEAGISMEDNARRKIARLKAIRDAKKAKAASMQPAAAAAPIPLSEVKIDEAAVVKGMPDPMEAGISMEENAKRKIARLKAIKAAKIKASQAGAAPAPAVDPAEGMPDPNEEGISSKEKAKRTMMIKRARAKAAKEGAAAPAAAADPAAGMPDPNEEGISSKEKAKRTMMIKRARAKAAKEGAAAPAAADPTAGMPDPDEPGISPKEKAKRTMMIRRAKKKAEGA